MKDIEDVRKCVGEQGTAEDQGIKHGKRASFYFNSVESTELRASANAILDS